MKALIVVDMLNDFVTGNLACERAQRIIPNISRLADASRRVGDIVVYSNDAHLPEVDAEFKIWGPHAVAGTRGAQVIPELTPRAGDFIVPKRRYSGFFNTDLNLVLLEHGVKSVVLTGLHTNICVRHTAADAFLYGYEIFVPENGVDSFTEKDHVEGLEYLKRVYGARITTAEELIEDALAVKKSA
jgi:nicotinamidase-related amidase